MLAYHFGYGAFGPARKGKRLRPNLVLRIAEEEERGSQPDFSDDRALDAAAAIELLHNYSLVHDDIEDCDELRHGKATLWKKYGVAQAINAGDAMCALSFLTLARAKKKHPAENVMHMIEVLHQAHLTMCDGQALDLQFEEATRVTIEEYERMITGKTAALFGAACELGALCAGSNAQIRARDRELGLAYGHAFQIRDDILGIWGASDTTGKTSANDIARRKWTFPIVWALTQESSTTREVIADAYASGKSLEEDAVEEIITALNRLGAREASERAIAQSLAAIESYPHASVRDYLLDSLKLSERTKTA